MKKENPNYLKDYKLKPTIIPPDFTLIVDTREQAPLFTRIPKGLTIISDTLENGDYGIKGFPLFAIERKGIGDLFPYCSSERDKTVKKMLRFKQMIKAGGWVGLVIENKESDVYQHQAFSRVHPEVIRGAVISFAVRYGVHVYFANNRDIAARYILDHAVRFFNVSREA